MPLNHQFIWNRILLFYIIFGNRNPLYHALGSNVPSARRPGQRFHFLQCRGSSPSLRFVNRHGGTLSCLHQDIFRRKVTDIAFTSDFCNNYSHPASPASLYLTSPRPIVDVPKSLNVSRPQVSSCHTRFAMSPSQFYTQPNGTAKANTVKLETEAMQRPRICRGSNKILQLHCKRS